MEDSDHCARRASKEKKLGVMVMLRALSSSSCLNRFCSLKWSLYQLYHMSNPNIKQHMELYNGVNVIEFWNFAPLRFESLLLLMEKWKVSSRLRINGDIFHFRLGMQN